MEECIYRLAAAQDKQAIINFMDENWGGKHPLLHVEDFFNHYYKTESGINFTLAETQTHEIKAVCGFILCNQTGSDIWTSIWCAKKEKGSTGVGLELLSRLKQLAGAENLSCNNIRPEIIPFQPLLGHTADALPQYYMLNHAKTSFTVAKIENLPQPVLCEKSDVSLKLADDINALSSFDFPKQNLPRKDLWYVNRRYFNYPHQSYNVYGCVDINDKILGILVVQRVDVQGEIVLRIVDFIGEVQVFEKLGYQIQALLQAENAEYVDCYCYGVPEKIFEKMGFTLRKENDQNIIPNYLTPVKNENTDYYFYTSNTKNFTMWKADGDQNRPNIG